MGTNKVNIINLMQLIASRQSQLEYQRAVPLVNVASELVNQWFCDFYHPKDKSFDSEFTLGELEQLDKFNLFYDARVNDLPDTLDEFMQSDAWSEVINAAASVLSNLGWSDLKVSYED